MPKISRIKCSHRLNMNSHIQQVPVPLVKSDKERVRVCMKQTEKNLNSNNGVSYSKLCLRLHRGNKTGGCV